MKARPGRAKSERVLHTSPPIMQVMRSLAKGRDVLDLSQGVPFFDPPGDCIREALLDLKGLNRYGPDEGDPDLKELISRKLGNRNGITAAPDDGIMVTSGANLGFLNASATVCDVGDDVVLLDPFYFNHHMALDILGIRAVRVPTDDMFMPVPENIERSIGGRTRAIVLVSPNNPTGMTYPKKLVEDVLDICIDREIWLISDETYEGFNFDAPHFSPGSGGEDVPVISLFSLSKSHSLSGWRIGYMSYPPELHEGMLKVQDTTVICPSRISQKVAYYCLKDRPDHLSGHIGSFMRSREMVVDWQKGLEGIISAPRPNGAYYSFPRLLSEGYRGGSMKLVERVLEETGVLLVPGAPFGAEEPPHFRISYGNVMAGELKEALDRLTAFFERLDIS